MKYDLLKLTSDFGFKAFFQDKELLISLFHGDVATKPFAKRRAVTKNLSKNTT